MLFFAKCFAVCLFFSLLLRSSFDVFLLPGSLAGYSSRVSEPLLGYRCYGAAVMLLLLCCCYVAAAAVSTP